MSAFSKFLRKVIPAQYRPIGYLNNLAKQRTQSQVQQGAFAGMKYIDRSVGSAYIVKLLGTYERELTPCIDAIARMNPPQIVDIGAGEGYYAVGLARRIPAAKIIAFEMDGTGRLAVAEMARLNKVEDRIDIRGECTAADLQNTLANDNHPVVICDVEGAEQHLIDPTTVPALRKAVLLVEMHEFVLKGITDEIKKRFAATHRIEHIWQEPRSRTDFPWSTFGTRLLPKSYMDWAVSEWRPERMSWLWMEPKS